MDLNYMILPLIMTQMNHSMEYIKENMVIFMPLFLILYVLNNKTLLDNIKYLYTKFMRRQPKGVVVLESQPELQKNSLRYQAIMWFLSNNTNQTIYRSQEVFFRKWNDSSQVLDPHHFFRIDQNEEFIIKEDITGKITITSKDYKTTQNDILKSFSYSITISSYVKNITQLIDFLDDLVDKHKKHMINKTLSEPSLVEATFNKKTETFDFTIYKWETNVTFENKFFENKEEILKQIDFFVENPKYFEEKGIPHQLGIMLHGVPGCGKTSFIKALAKKTKRHIVDIKLGNNIDLSKLKKIFLNEQLTENIIIPINKRLYVLEDIDAMGSIVHKRKSSKKSEKTNKTDAKSDEKSDAKSDEKSDAKSDEKSDEESDEESDGEFNELNKDSNDKSNEIGKTLFGLMHKNKKKTTNNMSYLLNILDGIHEIKDRMIVMTTNHIDKIDPAVIRSGRIDINIETKPANKIIIEQIISHYWNKVIKIEDKIESLPHCKVVDYCRSSKNVDETMQKLKVKQYSLF